MIPCHVQVLIPDLVLIMTYGTCNMDLDYYCYVFLSWP